uniref:Nose resistant-to-fluoxetine protein N-terminal domain-containing protein n=1 Tax=Acrobeloides nanus TaxID=290746 RepID=A0A914E5Q7_9BILA
MFIGSHMNNPWIVITVALALFGINISYTIVTWCAIKTINHLKRIKNIMGEFDHVSIECATDLGIIYEALQKNSSIPSSFISEVLVPMFDSSGKLDPGFLTGAFTLWGYPPQCLRIDYKFPWSDRHFIGSYSRVIMGIILGIGILSALVDYFVLPEDSINRKMDSFFFISGVLLAFIWFKELKKDKGKVMSVQGWVLFYMHRIVR